MNTTDRESKGFVFSFDLVAAFVAALLMLSLILMHSNAAAKEQAYAVNEFAAMQKAIFLADTFVKNSDSKNQLLGSAAFNSEKRRVESNCLSKQLLLAAKEVSLPELSIKKIAFKTIGREKEQIVFEKSVVEKNCIALDRFVLIEGEKAIVSITVCG